VSDDLVAFLRARLDEDEATARAAAGLRWFLDSTEDSDQRSIRYTGPSTLRPGDLADYYVADRVDEHDAAHIARHDPARVLREVEAKRAIVDAYENSTEGSIVWDVLGFAATTLAAIWRDHPDYRQEWKP
jgi:hypothetical protein